MTSLIYLAGPPSLKIKRAIESTGLEVKYFQLDTSQPWLKRLQVLSRALAVTWQERERAGGLMMDFIGNYSLAALVTCRLLARVPFILRFRGDIWHETREALSLTKSRKARCRYQLNLRLDRFVARHANLVLPMSTFLKERILAEAPGVDSAHVVPVPEFIDLDYFRPDNTTVEARRKLGLPDDALVVCTVTNFYYKDKARGLYAALAVLDKLMVADCRIHWLIAGSGPYYPEFVETVLSRAESENNIHFLGACSDIKSIYAAADLLIHFSFMDGFPAVVLEAQACGLPVIVNKFGGMPQQVKDGETGYIVDPINQLDVQLLVRQLLDDPERRITMGRAGRRWIELQFNYEAVGKRFMQALDLMSESTLPSVQTYNQH